MTSGVPDFPVTLPAKTVVGRLASTAGPAEAVPIAALSSQLADASMINFLQSGAGAVARSVQEDMRELGVSASRFGVVADGVTDDSAAWALAIAALPAGGGTILFPAKGTVSICASGMAIATKIGVKIVGQAGSSQIASGSTLRYTGAGTEFINISGPSASISFRDLNIQYTNAAFAGSLVKVRAGGFVMRDCGLSGNGVSGALYLLDMDTVTDFNVENCIFDKAQYGILGQAVSGASFCNIGRVVGCTFNTGITVGDIRNPGQGWDISGTDFEGLAGGTGKAILVDSGVSVEGLDVGGCWFGDASGTTTGWIEFRGKGLNVHGCRFNGDGGLTSTAIIVKSASSGIEVSGNAFQSFSIALDIGASLTTNVFLGPNGYTSVTTPLSGTPVAQSHYYRDGAFTPTANAFTTTGSPIFSGLYERVGDRVYFTITCNPNGGTIASVAGASNFTAMPFTASNNDVCYSSDTNIRSNGVGLVSGTQVFTPAWAATGVVTTVAGSYKTAAA